MNWESLKDLFIALGGIGGIITGVIAFIKWRIEHAEVVRLNTEIARLNGQLGSAVQQLNASEKKNDDLRSDIEKQKSSHLLAVQELSSQIKDLSCQIVALQDDVAKRERRLRHQENLSKKLLKMNGEFFRAKARTKKPVFMKIGERGPQRKPAIFSILNLKGGVGKTTLTANIGAAFASLGQRVLFVDVDLQGSLTSLLLDFKTVNSLHDDNRMLQDFLTTISSPGPVNILPFTQPVFQELDSVAKCCIVPTSDQLAYADMNLMTTWMLGIAKRDSRFLLRRALHQKRVFDRFDIVLIDCPPFLNTCCINALAASDFVIVPVIPSENSTDRVPQLLHTLRHSIFSLNPSLAVAGIVYNQVRREPLSAAEQAIWDSVLNRAEDQFGSPIRGFKTFVRNMTEIRDNESDFNQPVPGDDRYEVFQALAQEILEVIPND